MLEITKITFSEKPSVFSPSVTKITGGIQMLYELSLDENYPIPRKVIHDRIREELWHKVYGDLLPALHELQDYALRHASLSTLSQVEKLCGELNELLAIKSPYKQPKE